MWVQPCVNLEGLMKAGINPQHPSPALGAGYHHGEGEATRTPRDWPTRTMSSRKYKLHVAGPLMFCGREGFGGWDWGVNLGLHTWQSRCSTT
jgi:hypothetical protein